MNIKTDRKKMSRKKKISLSILAVFLVIIISGATFTFASLGSMVDNSVPIVTKGPEGTKEPEPSLEPIVSGIPEDAREDSNEEVSDEITPIYKQTLIDKDVINVLVIGDDARPGEKRGRSDSMVLISVNKKLNKVCLTSFLRDTWVYIPGKGYNRLNAAYAYGGPGLLINTINEAFGLDIQYYATMRFETMMDIVDELGGVEVTLTKAEADYMNKNPRKSEGYDLSGFASLKEGKQILNGTQALVHCRNRYVGSADFDRTRRQRDVMFASLNKLKANASLSNITKFVNIGLKNVKTNMSTTTIISLAMDVLTSSSVTFKEYTMPAKGTWQYARINGMSVVKVDLNKNAESIKKLIYSE